MLTGKFLDFYPKPGELMYVPHRFILTRRTRKDNQIFFFDGEVGYSYEQCFPRDLTNEQLDELVELAGIPEFINNNFLCWRGVLGNYMKSDPKVMARFKASKEGLWKDSVNVTPQEQSA